MQNQVSRVAHRGGPVVEIGIRLLVVDEAALRRFVGERYRALGRQKPHFLPRQDPASLLLNVAVAEALVFSNSNPRSEAYGISVSPNSLSCVRKSAQVEGEPVEFVLRLRVHVFDEAALWGFALQRYRKRRGHTMADGIPPENLTTASAVLHALVFSGDNPDPRAFGVQFINGAARLVVGQPRSFGEVATLPGGRSGGESLPLPLAKPGASGSIVPGDLPGVPPASRWISVVPPGAESSGECPHSRVAITFYSTCRFDCLVDGNDARPACDDYEREILSPFDIRCLDCSSGGHFERLDQAPEWVREKYRHARSGMR
jgi:hypothetical protein